MTARPKVRCSSIQFFAVVIDMLQDVNVDDRIELPAGQGFLQCSADGFVRPPQFRFSQTLDQLAEEFRVGLQAYPRSGTALGIEKPSVRSNPGSHFKDVSPEERAYLLGPV